MTVSWHLGGIHHITLMCIISLPVQESESDEEVELTFEQRRQRNIRELEAVKRQLGLV